MQHCTAMQDKVFQITFPSQNVIKCNTYIVCIFRFYLFFFFYFHHISKFSCVLSVKISYRNSWMLERMWLSFMWSHACYVNWLPWTLYENIYCTYIDAVNCSGPKLKMQTKLINLNTISVKRHFVSNMQWVWGF